MRKIVFENMPETYEKGNLIFFKEPYRVNGVTWGMVHSGCRTLILSNDLDGLMVDIIAYPKSKDFNIEIYNYLDTLTDEEKSSYIVLAPQSGGGLTEVYE